MNTIIQLYNKHRLDEKLKKNKYLDSFILYFNKKFEQVQTLS